MKNLFDISISNHFSAELPADGELNNYRRQVNKACFSLVDTKKPSNPKLVHLSEKLLAELEIKIDDKPFALDVLSGTQPFKEFKPYAMCYGGHQFGHWAGQLGDGRAINIAELDISGINWKFQLKGSGPTPYSRSADGLAVLRSSIREYLCSEAMHALGVPTTRALSLITTGDLVRRDILYDGNPQDEQGAIVCRVAPSFIRFGNFQIFAARQDTETLKKITDYTIKHHFPELGEPSKKTYIAFFKKVVDLTKDMIVHWQRVGFVHGVMNTDNMSILGLTIDYGPYGWLENYDIGWTPNTTDAQNKRYRFGNQPNIALWNLVQLANALYPLIEEVEPLQEILDNYQKSYTRAYHKMMCEKLGLLRFDVIASDFIEELTKLMQRTELDMTLFFRELSGFNAERFNDFWNILKVVSYDSEVSINRVKTDWNKWFKNYQHYINDEQISSAERQLNMKKVNPKYVLRNYMAQLAIEAAENGDFNLIDELYKMLLNPYSEQSEYDKWYAKRPDWAKHKVGCSMLSCSS